MKAKNLTKWHTRRRKDIQDRHILVFRKYIYRKVTKRLAMIIAKKDRDTLNIESQNFLIRRKISEVAKETGVRMAVETEIRDST